MSAIGQLSFPVRLAGGQLATVDQDSTEFVTEQVDVLCLIPLAGLPGTPEYGLADQRFRKGGGDIREIERQIHRWVPDAEAAVTHDRSALSRGLDRIGVQVAG